MLTLDRRYNLSEYIVPTNYITIQAATHLTGHPCVTISHDYSLFCKANTQLVRLSLRHHRHRLFSHMIDTS